MAKRGRKKNLPNLKRVDGGFMNQHGVFFTNEEKKALERAVNRSNYRRKKELEKDRNQMLITAGKVKGEKNQLYLMNKENDFIVAHQPRTLQRFTSKSDYNKFMRKQDRIQSGEYLEDRARLYKRNFLKSMKETYSWDECKDIYMKIQMMPAKDYIKMVGRDEVLEIRYVPSDRKVPGRLNQIRDALGMQQKDEWIDETYNI